MKGVSNLSKKMWMVRAGGSSEIVESFLSNGYVAISFSNLELGDLRGKSKDEIKRLVEHINPEDKSNISAYSQLNKFVNDIASNDYVITYDSSARQYHVGELKSEYAYSIELDPSFPHIRKANWLYEIDRDILEAASKNTLGSTLTIFQIKETVKKDILQKAQNPCSTLSQDHQSESSDESILKNDVISKSLEYTKDIVSKLNPDQMEELVSGVIRSMGLKTMITPKGKDRGKDIIASPDGLGLSDTKIFIEVKHRKGKMGADEIRRFSGGLRNPIKGLFVSTGGFTQEAKYEAERSNIPITLMDIDLLVDHIFKNYEKFDIETRLLVPLQKVYWPEI